MFIDNQQKPNPAGSVSVIIIPNISIIFDCPNSQPGWYSKIPNRGAIPNKQHIFQKLYLIRFVSYILNNTYSKNYT